MQTTASAAAARGPLLAAPRKPCSRTVVVQNIRAIRVNRVQNPPAFLRPSSGSRHASRCFNGRGFRVLNAAARECDGSEERKAKLILYTKPGCNLCEGLEEKLRAAMSTGVLRSVEELVLRDITTNTEWWSIYQLEVPVMKLDLEDGEKPLPRQSPRLSAERVGMAIQKEIDGLLGGHATHKGGDRGSEPGGGGSSSGGDPWTLQPVDWRKK